MNILVRNIMNRKLVDAYYAKRPTSTGDEINSLLETLRDDRQRGIDAANNGESPDPAQPRAFQEGHEYQLIVIEHQGGKQT